MSLKHQRITPERYRMIPRTLCFLFHENEVLLLEYGPQKDEWAGKMNGIGGHVEPGETLFGGLQRELLEEIGSDASNSRLCGVVFIETESPSPGVCLFVFAADVDRKCFPEPYESAEGKTVWVSLDSLDKLNLMNDLPFLIPETLRTLRNTTAPFSALIQVQQDGTMTIHFEP